MGKLANFTILADNPVTCDPMKIKNIAVWGTIMEGRVQPAPAVESTVSRRDSQRTPEEDLIVAHYQQTGWPGNPLVTPVSADCSLSCSCRLSHMLASLIVRQLEAGQP